MGTIGKIKALIQHLQQLRFERQMIQGNISADRAIRYYKAIALDEKKLAAAAPTIIPLLLKVVDAADELHRASIPISQQIGVATTSAHHDFFAATAVVWKALYDLDNTDIKDI